MKKIWMLVAVVATIGAGCRSAQVPETSEMATEGAPAVNDAVSDVFEPLVQLPLDAYVEGRTFKLFGEEIADRFTGYHVGDDVEVADVGVEVPVYAIADGMIRRAGSVDGYGGVYVIEHEIGDDAVWAIYGHVDLESADWKTSDYIRRGDVLGNLGDHESAETDGERKHLHFALYRGNDVRLSGYESSSGSVNEWLNPHQFFLDQGIDVTPSARRVDMSSEPVGGETFPLAFDLPAGWGIEYVPSIESLNLFTLAGEGTARERSQIFIRYFDASSFLTLSTVDIFSTEDLTVGTGDYPARRYDIEKQEDVLDFPNQPDWRNGPHTVTDVRAEDGFTRYYVVAANPALDRAVYDAFLARLTIAE